VAALCLPCQAGKGKITAQTSEKDVNKQIEKTECASLDLGQVAIEVSWSLANRHANCQWWAREVRS
jgi:hypothetical protein